MWTYQQRTGALLRPDGSEIARGYSGFGMSKNEPSAQNLKDQGPIPQGVYYIGKPVDTITHGPFVLPLEPSPDNDMFGRSGFLIHGDSMVNPGSASEGCIIMPILVRKAIAGSDDMQLQVVPG